MHIFSSLDVCRSVLLYGLFVACAAPTLVSGQTGHFDREDPENFRVEVMGSGWLVNSTGQIQANGTPADFINDLGVAQRQGTFFGHLVVKPARRHRIEMEGSPFGLHGLNTIDRSIVYQGRTFAVNQSVTSNANLDYFFAGYQYDLLSGAKGHLGLSAGGAYLRASGTLETQVTAAGSTSNVSATKSQTVGLPLAGFDFRLFPLRRHNFLEIEGGMRGMDFGSYGYYVQAIAQGGVCLGPVTILAGYRAVDTSIVVTSNAGSANGLTARLQGPIFSGMFRW
jgi:hypothetical protein